MGSWKYLLKGRRAFILRHLTDSMYNSWKNIFPATHACRRVHVMQIQREEGTRSIQYATVPSPVLPAFIFAMNQPLNRCWGCILLTFTIKDTSNRSDVHGKILDV